MKKKFPPKYAVIGDGRMDFIHLENAERARKDEIRIYRLAGPEVKIYEIVQPEILRRIK